MKKSIAKMLIIAFSVGSCVGCGQNQTESVSETNTAMVQDDIVILYTSDVHCGIDENIGYAGLVSYKEWVEEKTPYVTLVVAALPRPIARRASYSEASYSPKGVL